MAHLTRRLVAIIGATLIASTTAISPVTAQDDITADGHLARIIEAGVIRMSTDGLYPPQSELTPDGTYVGFDIDVGTEIANRLGVDIELTEPGWALITAGSWGDRWDMSVGSMTITSARQEAIDFTQPYYYTPAQFASLTELGYSRVDDLDGKSICMGDATTYLDWMLGVLDFGTESPTTAPPEGAVAVTRPTDRDCAQEWGTGRRDFEGWLTSSVTIQDAVADGLPLTPLGSPVFYEPLAVAFDKSVDDNDSLVVAVDAIIADMHADGTLSALSQTWYGQDLTQKLVQ
ncbi:MAG TPA: transporter substrate-binding domain-containing protein [Candidatus Limnocylindrales bacterium]|nr:transporter substrate-binding domain-containing protein [Candidatus Limnocylindrales bacterium]